MGMVLTLVLGREMPTIGKLTFVGTGHCMVEVHGGSEKLFGGRQRRFGAHRGQNQRLVG